MVDDHVALVAIGEGEGRAGDGLIDADRPSEALGEVGLACAEITDEHEEIAIDDQGGNLGRQGLGSGDVGGGAGDHPSRLPTVLRWPSRRRRRRASEPDRPGPRPRPSPPQRSRRRRCACAAGRPPGQPIVGTLGDNEALPGVEHGVDTTTPITVLVLRSAPNGRRRGARPTPRREFGPDRSRRRCRRPH